MVFSMNVLKIKNIGKIKNVNNVFTSMATADQCLVMCDLHLHDEARTDK